MRETMRLFVVSASGVTLLASAAGRGSELAEAKARVEGGDGLEALARAIEKLERDPSAPVATGHRRKWDEHPTGSTAPDRLSFRRGHGSMVVFRPVEWRNS
jgi:hypothetical protein